MYATKNGRHFFKSSSAPPSTFSSTQEAFSSVENEIKSFRATSASAHQKSMEFIGQGVRELKQEISYLGDQLERSRQREDFLRHKLSYFERKEED